MIEKTPRFAGKAELIRLLSQRDAKIASLEKTVSELREHDRDKALSFESFENAGSIAEASLQVSNIFSAAQESADKYLESIREMEKNSRQEADRIIASAKTEAEALVSAAEQKCAEREAQEKAYIDSLWVDLQTKLLEFYERYSELGELFAKMNFAPSPDNSLWH